METAKQGEMVDFKEAKVFTGAPTETAMDIISGGRAMVQSKAGYHTAVRVQKSRDLDEVVKAVKKEAEYAADNFYYRWPVKDKRTGKTKNVEGGTIGCALSIARNWTNCVITMEVDEHPGYWIFTPSFVDLETGFTVTRSFKKTKPRSAPGNFDQDRWEDVAFQKGQSQAIRNVVFNGVPQWLRNEAVEAAKVAALNHISRDGIVKARDKAMAFLAGYGITEDRVKLVMEKPINDFTANDVQTIRNLCQQIQNGDVTADEAFPPIETTGEPEKPKTTRTKKAETQEQAGTVSGTFQEPPKTNGNGKGKITMPQAQIISGQLNEFQLSVAAFKRRFEINNIEDLPADQYDEALTWLNTEIDKQNS